MRSHYSKLVSIIAAGILLLGNLSIATPALADNHDAANGNSTEIQSTENKSQSSTTTSKEDSQSSLPQSSTEENQQTKAEQDANSRTGYIQESTEQSAGEIAQNIKKGNVNDQDLINHTYQKIDQTNGKLNNVIYVDPSNAQQQLKKLESESKSGKPFYGVPILIKGLGQAFKGYPNTDGLPYLKGSTYHYTNAFVKKLQEMGFIILGETNFPELGLINITVSNLNGIAHNPWNLDHNTGGSSGGATASVAAGIVPIATGNDAGGSLRIPASWSGVIGLKPTQGLIVGDSLKPSVVNFADTRSIDDTVTLLRGLMDQDHAKKLLQPVPKNLKKVKIAYSLTSPVGTPVSQDAKNAVLNAVKFLRAQGFDVVEQNSPVDGVKMMQAYYLEALDDGSVADFIAQQKLHRHLTAADVANGVVSPMTYALYEASKKAPKNVSQTFNDELKLVHQQMTVFHNQYPIYLTPTTATVAPLNSDPAYLPEFVAKMLKIKELPFDQQMQLIYNSWLHGLSKTPFTQLANLAGEPALSLPTYISATGLPLGIQLEGAQGTDFLLLGLGKLFENNQQFIFLNDYKAQHSETTDRGQVKTTTPVYGISNLQNVNTRSGHDNSVEVLNNQQKFTKREVKKNSQQFLPQTGSYGETLLVTAGLTLIGMIASLGVIKLNKRF